MINMIPGTCTFCKGKLSKGRTDFTAKLKNTVVSITNVPAFICDHCGESYFTPDTSKYIDKIMQEFHSGKFLAHPIPAGEIEFEKEIV